MPYHKTHTKVVAPHEHVNPSANLQQNLTLAMPCFTSSYPSQNLLLDAPTELINNTQRNTNIKERNIATLTPVFSFLLAK
jgi:hypothetical protein